ncbi:MAG TPA: hypothetical protein VLV49_13495 [Terriglobales bacterium]|nr:hypothetical protein [Terriglobales bacterium]
MTVQPANSGPAAEWRSLRRVYEVYTALAREFVIDLSPCHELEGGEASASQQTVEMGCQWLLEVDERVSVHQLRQFLQSSTLTSEESLAALLRFHLRKASRGASERDKVDFLLVQFFSHCVPARLDDAEVTPEYVAKVLEPVLGKTASPPPASLSGLEELIQSTEACQESLQGLLGSGILEQGRALKAAAQADYFTPAAMVAFTRFNFRMRRAFFRLLHQDLNVIIDGLRELEGRGVEWVDGRPAEFSANEPVARLRMICQSWKVMFQAEYSSGQPLRTLVDLRAVVEAALGRPAKEDWRARAAAAGPGDATD